MVSSYSGGLRSGQCNRFQRNCNRWMVLFFFLFSLTLHTYCTTRTYWNGLNGLVPFGVMFIYHVVKYHRGGLRARSSATIALFGVACSLLLLSHPTPCAAGEDNVPRGADQQDSTVAASSPPPPPPCWCADPTWCTPISTVPEREVFAFFDDNSTWPYLDYDVMTTASAFLEHVDPAFVCHAHSKGVRVVKSAPFPKDQLSTLSDPKVRAAWVALWMSRIKSQGFDGLTLDIEQFVKSNNR